MGSQSEQHELFSVDSLDTCQMPFCATRDDEAPVFTATALINGEISEVDLLSERGKWVILFFYSSNFTFV